MIIIIIFLVSLGHLSTDLYLPSLPAIAQCFNVNATTAQLTVSFYLIGMSFSPLIFGPLSDALGRKKIIICGLILITVATIGCSIAPNIYVLIISRAMQGIASGAIIVSARAMIPDLYSGKELAKRITQVIMLMPLILSIAPTIGGYIQEYFQWRIVFLFLLIYVSGLWMVVPRIADTIKVKKKINFSLQHPFAFLVCYKDLLNNTSFMLYGIYSMIPISGMFAYLTISSFLFQKVFALSPVEYGRLSLYIGGGILMGGYINTKLIKILSLEVLLFISSGIAIIAGGSLWFFTYLGLKNVLFIILPVMLFYICSIIGIGNATSKALSYLDGSYGTARALLTTCQFLIGAISSFIFAMLPVRDGLYLSICFMINAGLMVLCVLKARRITQQEKVASSWNYVSEEISG